MAHRKIFLSDICYALNLKMVGRDIYIDGLNLCNRESIHQHILTYATSGEYIGMIMNNPAVVAVVLSGAEAERYRDALEERGLSYITADLPEKIFYNIHEYLYNHTDFYHKFDFERIIGEGVYIHPSAVIENGVIIGNGVVIEANTVIRHGSVIEDYCKIGCNTVIGAEGFQVIRVNNENRKIVHVGGVLIKNNACVGDNVCICNSLFENTGYVGRNVMIDNLCYIAHNVIIGDNAIITAGCMLCGSVVIDEGVYLGINSMILNRMEIGSNSKIGMGSVVTKNIPGNSLAYGAPARVKTT